MLDKKAIGDLPAVILLLQMCASEDGATAALGVGVFYPLNCESQNFPERLSEHPLINAFSFSEEVLADTVS